MPVRARLIQPFGSGRASGRAAGLESRERDRLARRAIRPQDELKRLVIGLTGFESRIHHGRALCIVRARASRQAQSVTKHYHVLLAPLVEMPKPQLFIDE